jgi:protein-tyrosine-phosphatase
VTGYCTIFSSEGIDAGGTRYGDGDADKGERQKLYGPFRGSALVELMGCGDACPYIPGKRYIDWNLPDPKSRPIEEVRATRDEIQRRVAALVAELEEAG